MRPSEKSTQYIPPANNEMTLTEWESLLSMLMSDLRNIEACLFALGNGISGDGRETTIRTRDQTIERAKRNAKTFSTATVKGEYEGWPR